MIMPDSKSFGQQLLGSLKQGLSDAVGGLPSTAVEMGVSAFNHWLANRAAEKQYNRQIDFWQMQNEYNSPVEQRKRLMEAGLNPVAAAGDIGGHNTAGNLSTVPGNEYAQKGVFDPGILGKNMLLIKQMESIGANTDLLERQVELSFIQEYIMNAEAYGLDLSNEEKKKLLSYIDKEKELSFEKVVAEIENIKSSTTLNESSTELNEANTATVNALRDHLVEVQKASAESLKSSAALAREQCKKTKEETEKLSDEDRKRTWEVTIGEFFGLADISILAPELQAKAAEYYWDFQYYGKTYESTIDAFQAQVDRYVEKNGHIVQSTGSSRSVGVKVGPISASLSGGSSGSY